MSADRLRRLPGHRLDALADEPDKGLTEREVERWKRMLRITKPFRRWRLDGEGDTGVLLYGRFDSPVQVRRDGFRGLSGPETDVDDDGADIRDVVRPGDVGLGAMAPQDAADVEPGNPGDLGPLSAGQAPRVHRSHDVHHRDDRIGGSFPVPMKARLAIRRD